MMARKVAAQKQTDDSPGDSFMIAINLFRLLLLCHQYDLTLYGQHG